MALHTGLHWSMVVKLGTKFRKKTESEDELTWFARGFAAAISIFGIYAFVQQNMPDYLILENSLRLLGRNKDGGRIFNRDTFHYGLVYNSRLLWSETCERIKRERK